MTQAHQNARKDCYFDLKSRQAYNRSWTEYCKYYNWPIDCKGVQHHEQAVYDKKGFLLISDPRDTSLFPGTISHMKSRHNKWSDTRDRFVATIASKTPEAIAKWKKSRTKNSRINNPYPSHTKQYNRYRRDNDYQNRAQSIIHNAVINWEKRRATS